MLLHAVSDPHTAVRKFNFMEVCDNQFASTVRRLKRGVRRNISGWFVNLLELS